MTYRGLSAIPGVAALLAAMVLSRLASRMFALALVLYALERFGSPALAGWLTFAAVAPGLLVSPLAGTVLDRFGAAAAVKIDLAASAAFLLLIAAVGSAGCNSSTVLFGLAAAYSVTTPLGAAGVRVMLPRLAGPAALDTANGADTAIHALVGVLGPAVAGLLMALAGGHATLAIIAAVYAAAALWLAKVPCIASPPRLAGSVWRQAAEGLTAVVRDPTMRGLAISYSLYQVLWGVLIVVVPVYAAVHHPAEWAETAAGLLFAIMGVAGGVGALAAGRLQTFGRERMVMLSGMLAAALAAWPLAAQLGLASLMLALVVVGLAAGPIDVALLTLRYRRTDPQRLGRVLSVSMSLNVAGTPIGSALAGMVMTGSPIPALILGAIASALGAVATLTIPRDRAGRRQG